MRVADGKPARSHALPDGAAGRRWLGRGARDLSVYSSGSLVSSLALMVVGLMPVWSLAMASASNAGWTPTPPPGGRPWWSAKMGAGSGGVSLNKLAGTAASGRWVLDPLGWIWCCLVEHLLVAALRWSEPQAMGRRATGASVNKGLSSVGSAMEWGCGG